MSASNDRTAVEIDELLQRVTLVGLGEVQPQPAANDNREDSGVRRIPNAAQPAWKFVNDGGMRM